MIINGCECVITAAAVYSVVLVDLIFVSLIGHLFTHNRNLFQLLIHWI